MVHIGNRWDELLADEFASPSYKKLREFLKYEYSHYTVYPEMHDIFNALAATDYDDVKAVILGQDPYHGQGQAHGLCFSVKPGVQPPPSLMNIFKELHNDVGVEIPECGDLTRWAQNGVLLLNTVLTVRAGAAGSHRGKGWERITDRVIELLNERQKPMVFMLWGRPAREKAKLITNPRHLVLECAHPSPLSAYSGFFGCRHFSKAAEFLRQNGTDIDWSLDKAENM